MLAMQKAAVHGRPVRPTTPRSAVLPGALVSSRRAQPKCIQCTAASPNWPAHISSAVKHQPVFKLAASVVLTCQRMVSIARESFSKAFPQLQNVNKQVMAAVDKLWLTTCCALVLRSAPGTVQLSTQLHACTFPSIVSHELFVCKQVSQRAQLRYRFLAVLHPACS